MTNTPLPHVRACVFDAYGTLFDTASAVARAGVSLGAKAAPLAALWREKQLQYTWLRSLQARHADFWQVTGEALDFALGAMGLDDVALKQRLMDAYLELDAFADVRDMLERLRRAGLKTAILSNGTPAMLAAAVDHNGLMDLLGPILSVEEAGVYKTHPKVYRLAVERLALEARDIVFVSANGWDAHAASAFGMIAVWCNRGKAPPERLPGRPDREITSLAELPHLVGA